MQPALDSQLESQPVLRVAAPLGTRMFAPERIKKIRNWQSQEFYARLVMRPLAIVMMLFVADWKWVTPNLVTTAANLAKLVGTALIVMDHQDHALAAAIWIQVGLLLDHLDGTIARYRACGTTFGSFYDKVSDAVTWMLITGAVGWAAYQETHDVVLPIAALVSAYALLTRGYMKWLMTAEQRKQVVAAAPSEAKAHEPPSRTAMEWGLWFASSLGRALAFEEVDLFFWVGLGLVLHELELLVWLLAVSQVIGALIMIGARALEARSMDLSRAR